MTHYDRDASIVLRHGHDAFPERDLSSRQTKRVDLFSLKYMELPLIIRFGGSSGNSLPNAPQLRLPSLIGGERRLFQNILIGVGAKLILLGLGYEHDL